jgi:hypothetical protein
MPLFLTEVRVTFGDGEYKGTNVKKTPKNKTKKTPKMSLEMQM